MLELNFSCPHTARVFARNMDLSIEILSQVKSRSNIPVGLKIGPTLEPLETVVANWEAAGTDFFTAHNALGGLFIDVEREVPFGAPSTCGYAMGRTFLPYSLARVVRIHSTSPPITMIRSRLLSSNASPLSSRSAVSFRKSRSSATDLVLADKGRTLTLAL